MSVLRLPTIRPFRRTGKIIQTRRKIPVVLSSTPLGNPLDLLRCMKFETVGCHPIEGRQLLRSEQLLLTKRASLAETLRLAPLKDLGEATWAS
jgi:hypothetical protein